MTFARTAMQKTLIAVVGLGAFASFGTAEAGAKTDGRGCIADEEIEAAVGSELRAGAFAVRTDMLGERPLCSGLPMAQAVQKLRARYFPEERDQSADRHNERVSAGQEVQTQTVHQGTGDGWQFTIDPANPENTASAQVSTIMQYGVDVTLFVDCSGRTIGMSAGYESNQHTLPEPRRSVVHNYERALMADPAKLRVFKEGREIGSISWDIYDGGHATITPARMRMLLSASELRLTGGSTPIPFGMANFREAVSGVMRQCQFRQ